MADIAGYVRQIQKLTQQNLDILSALNSSLYTNKEHLQVKVGDTTYSIPSFLSLENKIDVLRENFNNLIHAPQTGEAYFNVDGNSKTIELKGYHTTPERFVIDAGKINGFEVEQNNLFKDMLTPNPFIKIDLQGIPNDITKVNVKKVVLREGSYVATAIQSKLSGSSLASMEWSDLYKILSISEEGSDYTQYDTVRSLPIHKCISNGTFVIKSIDKTWMDDNLDQYVSLTLHEQPKYKSFDETIENYLGVGDVLLTYDNSAKMEVVAVNINACQITIKVLNGDYLNLVADPDGGDAHDMCKLKYYASVDYDSDRYINVPLEEDQYVCIFVSALNDRMGLQAPWGGGIVVDTNALLMASDNSISFKTYYDKYVRNVGDILNELSSVMGASIMKYPKADFDAFSTYIPTTNDLHLQVMQINNHLNDSETVQNIRSLYSQKHEYNRQLTEVQNKISELNNTLSDVSFMDTEGTRAAYESQLSQYNTMRNELVNNITKIIDEIAQSANDSVVPLENAKYHIRGYFDWSSDSNFAIDMSKYVDHILGVHIQYRYKNQNREVGSAVSIDDKFIFSDWNDMETFNRKRLPKYDINQYVFEYEGNNDKVNEPSFNQIDIPITQGEHVDIRFQILWDFGYPFVHATSQWSEIYTIDFPDEFIKEVQLMDIINENLDDLKNNQFKGILEQSGVNAHVANKLQDQDVTFFHKADGIASGFYTDERRVIPLYDKLLSLSQELTSLKDIVNATNANNLKCSVIVDGIEHELQSGTMNNISLPAYNTTTAHNTGDHVYVLQATLKVTNTTDHVAHIYSLFPGDSNIELSELRSKRCKFDLVDYVNSLQTSYDPSSLDHNNGVAANPNNLIIIDRTAIATNSGFIIGYTDISKGVKDTNYFYQTPNQWITFRTKDAYTGEDLCKPDAAVNSVALPVFIDDSNISEDGQNLLGHLQELQKGTSGMVLYPYLTDKDGLKLRDNRAWAREELASGESKTLPIMIHYYINENETKNESSDVNNVVYSKCISFDIRTSLYEDPNNFSIMFNASYADTIQEKVNKAESNRLVTSLMTAQDNTYQSTIKSE